MKKIVAIENDGMEAKLVVLDTDSEQITTHRMPIGIMKVSPEEDYHDKINFEPFDELHTSNLSTPS